MTAPENRDDRRYVITTPEEPAPAPDNTRAIADGHGERSRHEFLETRERLSSVEQQVSQTGDIVSRVEGKVDNLHEDISRVEKNALDKEYFDNQYKSDIEKNTDVVTIAIWVGGVVLALMGAYATLVSAGVV